MRHCQRAFVLVTFLQDMFLFDWATMPVQNFAQKLVTGDQQALQAADHVAAQPFTRSTAAVAMRHHLQPL